LPGRRDPAVGHRSAIGRLSRQRPDVRYSSCTSFSRRRVGGRGLTRTILEMVPGPGTVRREDRWAEGGEDTPPRRPPRTGDTCLVDDGPTGGRWTHGREERVPPLASRTASEM